MHISISRVVLFLAIALNVSQLHAATESSIPYMYLYPQSVFLECVPNENDFWDGVLRDFRDVKENSAAIVDDIFSCIHMASNGYGYSSWELGVHYMVGDFLPQDDEKAFACFMFGAHQGDMKALDMVTKFFLLGLGAPPLENPEKRSKWNELRDVWVGAVYKENLDQQFKMGCMWAKARNVSISSDLASHFFRMAVSNGQEPALYKIGSFYEEEGDDFLSAHYYLRAANQGHVRAQYSIGFLCEKRMHDYIVAAAWYSRAAVQGYGKALYKLGEFYEEGLGRQAQDYNMAIEFYEHALSKGYKNAEKALNSLRTKIEANYDDSSSLPPNTPVLSV